MKASSRQPDAMRGTVRRIAKEYVELMWRILQQDNADDFVIAQH